MNIEEQLLIKSNFKQKRAKTFEPCPWSLP
jgi:hypothetical protein